ncbi:VTT domain-containing protein [Metabacillus sp. RGM 3146]|uniref:VTT domain-containing protein n=1 Tax=Metabacillus sp. RGM 3146 TaxID=3401092 RepID=UPI003B9C1FA4
MMQFFTGLIEQYGYAVLVIALLLELIALPLPGEFLMGYSGFLIYQHKLNWVLSIGAASLGACIGMTISYWIGYKLGPRFFQKYGHRVHMGPERLEKLSSWFEEYGNKLLIIAYFIPGIRHITGYFSGMTQTSFRTYAVYAYIGAFIWTGSFISLGKLLGPKWEQFHSSIKKYLLIGSLIAIILFALIYIYKNYRKQIESYFLNQLGRGVKRFHSIRKMKILMVAASLIFLLFTVSVISLSESYLDNEFQKFNIFIDTIVPLVFDEKWKPVMSFFYYCTSPRVLISLTAVSLIWIMFRGRERVIEGIFLAGAAAGGVYYEELVRRIFQYFHPDLTALAASDSSPFPNEQTLLAFIIYGAVAYLLVRHSKRAIAQTAIPLLVIALLAFIGISRVYFHLQYPSDISGGYAFGGLWLSLSILIMEFFRFMKRMKDGSFSD